jgi:hypothetical protein
VLVNLNEAHGSNLISIVPYLAQYWCEAPLRDL